MPPDRLGDDVCCPAGPWCGFSPCPLFRQLHRMALAGFGMIRRGAAGVRGRARMWRISPLYRFSLRQRLAQEPLATWSLGGGRQDGPQAVAGLLSGSNTLIGESRAHRPNGWCWRGESNPHALLERQILSLVRLPVPPLQQMKQVIIPRPLAGSQSGGGGAVWILFCGTAILAVSFDRNTGEDARATNQTESLSRGRRGCLTCRLPPAACRLSKGSLPRLRVSRR
jgi:hypothetical protein